MTENLKRHRLLVFIVAFNAERTIDDVLSRIPANLSERYDVDVLIIDDASQDGTFYRGQLAAQSARLPYRLTILFNPVNQGYGGNQKIGFHYAIRNGYDWVALLHGDGQYAPERLPDLLAPLADGQADAVLGSRMLTKRAARQGGMPLYKYAGNRILTAFQNWVLHSQLSEFHTGYRLYSVAALKRIPFRLNSNDFHFDTQIIIQLLFARQRIVERPIPTYYGDEICHVNGLKYAANVCLSTLTARLQDFHIVYDPKYDCSAALDATDAPLAPDLPLQLVLIRTLTPGSRAIMVGVPGAELTHRCQARDVTLHCAVELNQLTPADGAAADFLVFLDDREFTRNPETFTADLQNVCATNPNIVIVLPFGNVGFILTRLLLLCGRFSYARRGILNRHSFRLFTLKSAERMFSRYGFRIKQTSGVSVPYRKLLRNTRLITVCRTLHMGLIRLRPSLFAYLFVICLQPPVSLDYLLDSAYEAARQKSGSAIPATSREDKPPPPRMRAAADNR